jgi:hypothetical protein|tara:strand:- start:512 stop:709 length:198 start_codon:yes stop_codon:yes gene_type:complete
MIQNNFTVQLYDNENDNKLDTIYFSNSIELDDNNENFTQIFEEELLDEVLKDCGIDITEVYYSIL